MILEGRYNKTSLKPGMLVQTTTSKRWQSTQYWNSEKLQWENIPKFSPILIISVDIQKIVFLYDDTLYSIHNCYNNLKGWPVWCRKTIK